MWCPYDRSNLNNIFFGDDHNCHCEERFRISSLGGSRAFDRGPLEIEDFVG
jgi:hypothetical protein